MNRVADRLCLAHIYFVLCFRSPISLAVVAVDAAFAVGATFRRIWSGTVDRDEEKEGRAYPALVWIRPTLKAWPGGT